MTDEENEHIKDLAERGGGPAFRQVKDVDRLAQVPSDAEFSRRGVITAMLIINATSLLVTCFLPNEKLADAIVTAGLFVVVCLGIIVVRSFRQE